MKLKFEVDATSRAGESVILKPAVGFIIWFTMTEVCIQWPGGSRSTHPIKDVLRVNPICEETGKVLQVLE